MGRWSDREIEQRAAGAEANRAAVEMEIDDCMALAMPWRRRGGARRNGFDRIFDSTGPTATHRFASRFQRDLTPPFVRWFNLAAGPLVPDDIVDGLNRELEVATRIIHAVLDASAFPKASHENYADLAVGTGALLATEGDDNQPIRWQSAPPWSLGIEEGASGRVENVFWCKNYPAWKLAALWPDAEWGRKTKEKIDNRETCDIEILQVSYYDPTANYGNWRIAILCKAEGEKAVVWETTRRSNPWIISRWWTTSGDPWGRGPLMLSLPDIKTANKTVEMVLRAAAYALAPPLMVLHDGVINPDQMRMAPNSLIRVARTGGPMGRSIEPLDIGSKVDLAQIVLEDLRGGIKRNLLDEQLPPVTGAVRSASEIVQRAKDLQYDAGAAFGRMNHEFVPAVIAAVIDLLDKRKVALISWDKLRVDHLTLKVTVTSPLARSQNLDDVQNTVQWLETMKAIGGDAMVAHSAKVEDVGSDLGGKMGVGAHLIRTKSERAQVEKLAAIAAAHAQPDGQPAGVAALSGGAQPEKFATAPANLALPAPGSS